MNFIYSICYVLIFINGCCSQGFISPCIKDNSSCFTNILDSPYLLLFDSYTMKETCQKPASPDVNQYYMMTMAERDTWSKSPVLNILDETKTNETKSYEKSFYFLIYQFYSIYFYLLMVAFLFCIMFIIIRYYMNNKVLYHKSIHLHIFTSFPHTKKTSNEMNYDEMNHRRNQFPVALFDSRCLIASSCFFLLPGMYAFSINIWWLGVTSFITTAV